MGTSWRELVSLWKGEVWTHTDTHTHTHTEGIQKTHRKKLAMGLECCTYA